ncbi:MAG: metallophosphoesterase [Magnetococcales bacterium]|nr:metallophosphoesterase [Magnetococcales bacterium]
MTTSPAPQKINFFQRLKATFIRPKTYDDVALTSEVHLKGDEIRVPFTHFKALRIILGKQRQGKTLWLYPEFFLDPSLTIDTKVFILIDPDHYFAQPSGFFRLEPGDSIVLGRADEQQQLFFHFPKTVAKKHLTIVHGEDSFVFKDLTEDAGSYIAPLGGELEEEKLVSQRMSRLARVRDIYGGPIELLARQEALDLLRQVNRLLEQGASRPLDDRGKPGGLVLPPAELSPLIIGDLHGQVGNLIKILSENHFLESLENGKICLILLGDAVHSEVDGEMENMETSILMMDFILKLIIRFPDRVFYLRGNHDSFSGDIRKSNIPQGILWDRDIRKIRGEEYKIEFDRFYANLPYLAKSEQFIVCHAAPPRSSVTQELLVNTHKYPGLIKELIWNRLQRPGYPAGYTKMDVIRLRKSLKVAPETPFIVAHNPLSDDLSVWLDAGNIKNHHIVFSGRTHQISVFFKIKNQMVPFVYSVEPDILYLLNHL